MNQSLPPNPNLGHLRNEAKALHKAFLRKSVKVCPLLRVLKRLANKSDTQILGAPLKLADIQQAVALKYGFKSWAAMKKTVESGKPREVRTATDSQWVFRTGTEIIKVFDSTKKFNAELNVYSKNLPTTPKLLMADREKMELHLELINGITIDKLERPDFGRLANLFSVLHASQASGDKVLCQVETALTNFLYAEGTNKYYMVDFEYAVMDHPENDVLHFLIYWSYLYDTGRFKAAVNDFLASYALTGQLEEARYLRLLEEALRHFDLPRWKFGKEELKTNKDIPANREYLQTVIKEKRPAAGSARAITFGEKEAWQAIEKGVADVNRLPAEIKKEIKSITVTGSLVRGDFVENRSDVDIHTVLSSRIKNAWDCPAREAIDDCFKKYFYPYRRMTINPYTWDHVCVSENDLPKTGGDFKNQRFKAFGIYFADTLQYHKTVWGGDFTLSMPAPVDPRPLVPDRISLLMDGARNTVSIDPTTMYRIPMLAGQAIVLLQVYFSSDFTLNKYEILPRYEKNVPDFKEKKFGVELWKEYMEGTRDYDWVKRGWTVPDIGRIVPFKEYYGFIVAAREVVERNKSGGLK